MATKQQILRIDMTKTQTFTPERHSEVQYTRVLHYKAIDSRHCSEGVNAGIPKMKESKSSLHYHLSRCNTECQHHHHLAPKTTTPTNRPGKECKPMFVHVHSTLQELATRLSFVKYPKKPVWFFLFDEFKLIDTM